MNSNEKVLDDKNVLRLLKEKREAKEALESLKAQTRDHSSAEIMAATNKWYTKIKALRGVKVPAESN
jgi:hypothetical protein